MEGLPDQTLNGDPTGNTLGRDPRGGRLGAVFGVVSRVSETLFRHLARFAERAQPRNDRHEAELLAHIARRQDINAVNDAMAQAGITIAEPFDHNDRAIRLSSLCKKLCERMDRIQRPGDLHLAVQFSNLSLEAVPPDPIAQVTVIGNVEKLLSRLQERPEELSALLATTDMVASPGVLLYERYKRLGDLRDLDMAIIEVAQAIAQYPPGHPDRPDALRTWSVLYVSRFDRESDPLDLEVGIMLSEESIAAITPDHPERAGMLTSLSGMYLRNFDRTDNLDDLHLAITCGNKAVSTTTLDHSVRVSALTNLGSIHVRSFERTGNLDDLGLAIQYCEDAVAETPTDDSYRAGLLNNSGSAYFRSFTRTSNLDDLHLAIERTEMALAATPTDHHTRTSMLTNLGIMFSARFERTNNPEDLQRAITYSNEAMSATPLEHPNHIIILSSLGNRHLRRFEVTGNVDDLHLAINYGKQAVDKTPPDNPDRTSRLSNLCIMLVANFKRMENENVNDLDLAIEHGNEIESATPLDHPDRANRLINIGYYLLLRYQNMGSEDDFNESIRVYTEAWQSGMSPPARRIIGARKSAALHASKRRWKEASSLLEGAIEMMPKVSLRSLKRDDQQYTIAKLSGLAADAFSMALQAERDASYALKLLELGRGIIMGYIIDCRSDLSDLKRTHPDVFDKFDSLRVEVDTPLAEPEGAHGIIDDQRRNRTLHRRKQAIGEMEETLISIRKLPGYEGFLLPPPPKDLMNMAVDGPIVIFNSTEFRSDAIIVTNSTIKELPLPKLAYLEAVHKIGGMDQTITKGTLRTYDTRNRQMKELLLWLWNVAVEPVFAELQRDGVIDNNSRTRVWWIGVGVLSKAPFHAAGDHSQGSTRNTLNQAISSYIPTIKALSYARQKELKLFGQSHGRSLHEHQEQKILSKPDTRLLLVTMPTTPGNSPLESVEQEANDIIDIAKGRAIRTMKLFQPSAKQVLDEIHSHHIIHFACHGVSDNQNPSDSRLLLQKSKSSESGSSEPEIDMLSVRDISNSNVDGAQLAYLSACSTADNPLSTLSDEAIHIAGGFQLAGFSHVLATMWESRDVACMQLAKDFYGSLFNGEGSEEHRRVAITWHDSVKRLRDKKRNVPLLWAPFIHTGA